jgi:hypothetical protein
MDIKVRKESGRPVVYTANRLRDGKVLWLDANGRWSESVADARIYEGEAAIAEGRATAEIGERAQEVVGVYHLFVTPTEKGPKPVSVREIMRAQGGPSTLYGLAERDAVQASALRQ